jgi:tetratricopeptide (TPR) repeat protein
MAAEDRVPDRARRALEGLRRLDGLGDAERTRGDEIARYVEREGWRFEDASKVLRPHMQLQGGRPAPVDTPEERARCKQAVEALDAYYAEHSTHWQSLWTAGMGRAALGEKEATLETWRRAVRNHPERAEIAREAALAFLRVDLIAEACTVNREATKYHPNDAALWCNRAVTELLNGDLEEAKRALAESQRLDAADPIARTIGARMAKLSPGGPLPRTLKELERG